MAIKSRAATRVSSNAVATSSTRRRVQRVATPNAALTTPPVPVKEKEAEPVMMQRKGKISTHMTPHQPAKVAGSSTYCPGCQHMPMGAFAMVALLIGVVVALSVFLIDAATIL